MQGLFIFLSFRQKEVEPMEMEGIKEFNQLRGVLRPFKKRSHGPIGIFPVETVTQLQIHRFDAAKRGGEKKTWRLWASIICRNNVTRSAS